MADPCRDLVDRITALMPHCQAPDCPKELSASPSDYFCSAKCQQRWYESRMDVPNWYVGAESGRREGGRLRTWGEGRSDMRRTRAARNQVAGDEGAAQVAADVLAAEAEVPATAERIIGLGQTRSRTIWESSGSTRRR